MNTSQKGFIVPVLLILAAFLLLGGGAYVFQSTQTSQPVTATSTAQDANKAAGIVVKSPQPNELVKLPITVRGSIGGSGGWTGNEGETGWVQVFDANGKEVSNIAILQATSDWLILPTSFEATVGDRQMMTYINTDTGYLKFTSMTAKDGETSKSYTVPIRFK